MPHVHLFTDWIWACCYGNKPVYMNGLSQPTPEEDGEEREKEGKAQCLN